MSKRPKIGNYIDEEEETLANAIESDDYAPGKNHLTAEHVEELRAAARATINEKRVKVSLRIPQSDLARLKARAIREGIPYQTLINSILHKEVAG